MEDEVIFFWWVGLDWPVLAPSSKREFLANFTTSDISIVDFNIRRIDFTVENQDCNISSHRTTHIHILLDQWDREATEKEARIESRFDHRVLLSVDCDIELFVEFRAKAVGGSYRMSWSDHGCSTIHFVITFRVNQVIESHGVLFGVDAI